MRPARHACETREESAHRERALVATAPDSTRNLISLYFKGMTLAIWIWVFRKVTRHPSTLTKSHLPFLANELVGVRIDATATFSVIESLGFAIQYRTLHCTLQDSIQRVLPVV